jgi:anti-sigma B factor antagonist
MIDPTPLLRSEYEDGRLVILLSGEIDLSNAESLETRIGQAIQVANVTEVVIDLTAIDFIDSRGLRLLTRISTAVAGRGAMLAVVAPPDSIARSVLDMTHMSDELAVRDSAQIAES